ncbi:head GIN domain-containing protein [Zobellia galactanivorans]|uniref:head GIN domain-containing protein n=1 Tax=Zobellia galactanivorans (strain DSM 12802 / CCUG 47099 / CIP 106680 / NCIMB 13871 / Dsij) TaxID=63186 RepID=UPI0026E1D24E|nr:head GIN domain-containing protein [Zobellia galactanivorans]MDO6808984.1 head GIN domain-containing protein [Zobellia galactanivorans]
MRTRKIIVAMALACVVLTSCDYEHVRASNEVSTKDLSLSDYDGLKVSNAFDVFVSFSDDEERIRIEANDNLHDRIVVAREGNKVIIKLKKYTTVRGDVTLKAFITTKDIHEFDLSGAASVTLETPWDIQRGEIELSGASHFTGEVIADKLEIDMNGASKADIFGNVQSVYADLSGSSDLRNYDLEIERLNIELSGASEAFLTANESIDVDATGASTLNYKGDAVISHQRLKGASQLKNRN